MASKSNMLDYTSKSRTQLVEELRTAHKKIDDLERPLSIYHHENGTAQLKDWNIEQIHDSVITTDLSGNITCWNQGSSRLFGYSAAEALGKHIYFIFENDSPAFFERDITQLLMDKEYNVIEPRLKKKSGSIFTVHLLTSALLDCDNRSIGIMFYLIDISQARLAEQQLEEIRKHTQLILDSTNTGVCRLDFNGKTTLANRTAAEMIDREVEELIGTPLHEMLHHSKADGTPFSIEDCPIHDALKVNRVRHVKDDVFWRKDGSSFPIEYVVTPIEDEQGQAVGAVVTFQELTEQKEAEKELRRKERKLKQQTKLLHEKNLAMREMFRLAEEEKNSLKAQVSINIDTFLIPMITTLKSSVKSDEDLFYLGLLEESLQNILSGFGHKLLKQNSSLSSREVEICNMIKSGLNSKTMASVLHLSIKTINAHRANIRKKLGIQGKQVNLETYIRSMK